MKTGIIKKREENQIPLEGNYRISASGNYSVAVHLLESTFQTGTQEGLTTLFFCMIRSYASDL